MGLNLSFPCMGVRIYKRRSVVTEAAAAASATSATAEVNRTTALPHLIFPYVCYHSYLEKRKKPREKVRERESVKSQFNGVLSC